MAKSKQAAKQVKPSTVRYPWDSWFTKCTFRSHKLTKGKDFQCQTHSMAVQIRNAAKKRNLGISVKIVDDVITIIKAY